MNFANRCPLSADTVLDEAMEASSPTLLWRGRCRGTLLGGNIPKAMGNFDSAAIRIVMRMDGGSNRDRIFLNPATFGVAEAMPEPQKQPFTMRSNEQKT